jgi:phosphatidylglycerol:prolipoprotein diacylglycerol transferase
MNIFLNFWQEIPKWIDPVAFSLFGFDVKYYSLMYIAAFATVYFLTCYRLKNEKQFSSITVEIVQDLMLFGVIGVILGGRIGYAVFYNFSYYLNNPLSLFVPYDFSAKEFVGIAGMSFHGGLIGVLVLTLIYIKVKKLDYKLLSTLFMPSIPLGYMFGRFGNFFNNELWGRETTSWLGMKVDGVLRHPSQLYEAFFEGFVIFVIFWIFRNNKYIKDIFLGLFILLYGVFRFFIEFLREPDSHIGVLALNLSLGQYLCLGMIIIGFVMILYTKAKKAPVFENLIKK